MIIAAALETEVRIRPACASMCWEGEMGDMGALAPVFAEVNPWRDG